MSLGSREINRRRLSIVDALPSPNVASDARAALKAYMHHPQPFLDLFQIQLCASGRILCFSDDGTWKERRPHCVKNADGVITQCLVQGTQSVDPQQPKKLAVACHLAMASTFLDMKEDDVVVFKDCNPANFAVDNLIVVSPQVLQKLYYEHLSAQYPNVDFKIATIDTMVPYYIGSNDGDVFSTRTMDKLMPASDTQASTNPLLQYKYVNIRHYDVDPLTGKQIKVSRAWKMHRLIWTIWNGPIDDDMEVDHKNSIPSDNRLDNLQLLSRKENMARRRHQDAPPREKLPVPDGEIYDENGEILAVTKHQCLVVDWSRNTKL